MKVVLVNDTFNAYHWGCTATSRALSGEIQALGYDIKYLPIIDIYNAKMLPKSVADFNDRNFFFNAVRSDPGLFERIGEADVVVINGEGTLHHLTDSAVKLLFLAYAAKKYLQRPVQIINHSAYPANRFTVHDNEAGSLYSSIYKLMDFIAIREPISHRLMGQFGIKAQLSFDCLPLTVREFYPRAVTDKLNYIVISDSVAFPVSLIGALVNYIIFLLGSGFEVKILTGARNYEAADSGRFLAALRHYGEIGYELVEAGSLQSWLDCISRSKLLVSGRFHHSIAAAFLGTPFVLMESNTPKNQALAEIFNITQPLSYSSSDFGAQLVERTKTVFGSTLPAAELLTELLARAHNNFDGLRKFKRALGQ
ncbi:MAG: polysaccharide pyruvyl transferase family protein [Gammaproteobacteria bacterium]